MAKLYKNKDWLYKKYIIERLSISKIAVICKCGITTIWEWLIRFNIKTRSVADSKRKTIDQKLWGKIDKKDNISECWEWIGCCNENEYGRIDINGKTKPSHIVVYQYFYKIQIKNGSHVHHMCHNPKCCNPFHLIIMNANEHIKHHNSGENSGAAKLNWEKVRQIRKEYTGKHGEKKLISKKFGVSEANIGYILNNKTWKK